MGVGEGAKVAGTSDSHMLHRRNRWRDVGARASEAGLPCLLPVLTVMCVSTHTC